MSICTEARRTLRLIVGVVAGMVVYASVRLVERKLPAIERCRPDRKTEGPGGTAGGEAGSRTSTWSSLP
jgi:hypothetical protein